MPVVVGGKVPLPLGSLPPRLFFGGMMPPSFYEPGGMLLWVDTAEDYPIEAWRASVGGRVFYVFDGPEGLPTVPVPVDVLLSPGRVRGAGVRVEEGDGFLRVECCGASFTVSVSGTQGVALYHGEGLVYLSPALPPFYVPARGVAVYASGKPRALALLAKRLLRLPAAEAGGARVRWLPEKVVVPPWFRGYVLLPRAEPDQAAGVASESRLPARRVELAPYGERGGDHVRTWIEARPLPDGVVDVTVSPGGPPARPLPPVPWRMVEEAVERGLVEVGYLLAADAFIFPALELTAAPQMPVRLLLPPGASVRWLNGRALRALVDAARRYWAERGGVGQWQTSASQWQGSRSGLLPQA